MADENYDVIIIGSGPGGSSTATLLQKRGVKCLLLEKNNKVGGKMASVDTNGYGYDLFPHGQVPMIGSAFEPIFEELGVKDEFIPALLPDDPREVITLCYRRGDRKEYKKVKQTQAMADPEPFFQIWDLEEEEKAETMKIMTEMISMTDEQIHQYDEVTMKEWLEERNCPTALYNYMGFHANASLAEPIDLVAASEQILIMKHMMLQGGGGQYKGGFGTLSNVMCREFESNGGTLIKNCKVDKINIVDGSVTGVDTPEGTFNAPVVVSSAGLQPTILKLCGEDHFDKKYVNYIRSLVPGWAFTSVTYFLSEPVMDTGMYVVYSDDSWLDTPRYESMKDGNIPDEVILFMVNHNFYDEEAAPNGQQVLVSGTVCSADPDAKEIEDLWKVMDKQMMDHFPEIMKVCERQEYMGPKDISNLTRDSVLPGHGGECVGLAQIIGQCGRHKPSSDAPVNGLYIAGADAGSEGMGTHQSALSGTGVARMVQNYLRCRARMR